MGATELFVKIAMPALWMAWVAYWIIAARDVKETRWQEPAGASALHGIPLLLCMLLLVAPFWLPAALTAPLVPPASPLRLIGTALLAAGLGFAAWARVHLGGNWSSHVVVKQDHALIRSGPYRLVRHPIYSGLLLALAGTALGIGEWRGLVALVFAFIGILFRVRAEEARMDDAFPDYAGYRRDSWALIPLVF
jgi:protein-S-isoprenylcysteine O-methyltransferase Ste14